MKVMAFNGSPRKKKWNTVTMLEHALAGARSVGAQTEMVHLYDMTYSGCISCFSCKKLGRKEDGVCAVQDELTGILANIRESCDAFIIGTPVYYGCESAATRAFLERLCFPNHKYAKDGRSLFPRRIKTGLVYVMNVDEERMKSLGYEHQFEKTRSILERHFGACDVIHAADTMQFNDYDEYESEMFDDKAKIKRHAEVFPQQIARGPLIWGSAWFREDVGVCGTVFSSRVLHVHHQLFAQGGQRLVKQIQPGAVVEVQQPAHLAGVAFQPAGQLVLAHPLIAHGLVDDQLDGHQGRQGHGRLAGLGPGGLGDVQPQVEITGESNGQGVFGVVEGFFFAAGLGERAGNVGELGDDTPVAIINEINRVIEVHCSSYPWP